MTFFHSRPAGGGLALLTVLLGLKVAAADVHTPTAAVTDYVVTLRRDQVGVAHIEAGDYGSLGYGEGYAAAEDHLCNISYELMRSRGAAAGGNHPG